MFKAVLNKIIPSNNVKIIKGTLEKHGVGTENRKVCEYDYWQIDGEKYGKIVVDRTIDREVNLDKKYEMSAVKIFGRKTWHIGAIKNSGTGEVLTQRISLFDLC